MPFSVQDLIKLNPDDINVRRSDSDQDYFVFSKVLPNKNKEIARLLIKDVLTEAIHAKALGWLQKICLKEKTIDMNDPNDVGGGTLLAEMFNVPALRKIIPFFVKTAQDLQLKRF